ncbi:MAG: CAAX prenyl protease-related protein [Verrucomicrobia bacterium]|nr:CAAX prenyl protease-related protein [Verrucomicrobiota bacterium]
MNVSKLRDDRTLAHVVPMVLFMVVGGVLLLVTGSMESVFRKHEFLPWWRSSPEHWIYPLQTLVAGAALVFWRKQYDLQWSTGKVLFGALMGVVGIGLWILPTQTYEWMGLTGEPTGWLKRLGVMPRREGFDPGIFESAAGWWTATVFRFLRAVVVVALVEELLWRGFLMRFVLKPDGDYWEVPFGEASWRSYLIVTALVVVVHQPEDYAGALVWGTLMYLVAVRTKSLLACVVMHGVGNFLMGWYALAFEKYGLW